MPPFRRQIGKSRIYHSIIKQTAVFTDLLVLCPLYMRKPAIYEGVFTREEIHG
jgi:hypothetical protein